MPAATGGKPGRAVGGCEMSDGREAVAENRAERSAGVK